MTDDEVREALADEGFTEAQADQALADWYIIQGIRGEKA